MSINITPEFWGPHGWIFLHSVTFNYPENPTQTDKINYKSFFESLGNILPCEKCSINYKNHIQKYPIDTHLDSKTSLIQWLINIHNITNSQLGKSVLSPTEVINEYRNMINKSSSMFSYMNCFIVLSFIILIIIIYTCYNQK
jgi:ATP-dependent Zn protease